MPQCHCRTSILKLQDGFFKGTAEQRVLSPEEVENLLKVVETERAEAEAEEASKKAPLGK